MAERRKELKAIAHQLRAAATTAKNAPTVGTFAERQLLSIKQGVDDALRRLTRVIDCVRVEQSEEQLRVAAVDTNPRRDLLRPTSAKSTIEEMIEWLASVQHYAPRTRFAVRERGGADDRYARDGAVAEITGGSGYSSRSLALGGELGIRVLRGWPRTRTGALAQLGPVGVARIAAGVRGERQVRAGAAELERVQREERERVRLLESVAEVQLSEARARGWITYERRRRAESSEEGLGEVLGDLGDEAGVPDTRDVRRRLSLAEDLHKTIPESCRYEYFRHLDEMRHAALRSGVDLQALLLRWSELNPPIPFGPGALERALHALRASAPVVNHE